MFNMLVKLFFKRILPASLVYYFTFQAYVMYNAFNGEPRLVSVQAIDILSLPEKDQATRTEMIHDSVDYYNTKLQWRHFHEEFILEDPLVKVYGIESVVRNVHFWEVYMGVDEVNTTLKSVTHYKSSIKLELCGRSKTRFGRVDIDITTWLEVEKYGDSEKIIRMNEEWNDIPNISQENTMFPIGWSAEMMRVILGKIIMLFPL